MTARIGLQLPLKMNAIQCEQDLVTDPASPASPVVDLQKDFCDMLIHSPPNVIVIDNHEESVDIKSQPGRVCCESTQKRSKLKCFDRGPSQPVASCDRQLVQEVAPRDVTDSRYDVIDLVNSLEPPRPSQCEELHTEKHPEKGFCSKVKCIDEAIVTDSETPWRISANGLIVQGTCDIVTNVKEFSNALKPYHDGIKSAEKMGIPASCLVVTGEGKKVTDVHLGNDGVRGVHLFSTAFDPSMLVPKKKLGDGQFGSVLSCTKSDDGAKYAVKQVSLEKLNPYEPLVMALATSQQHQQGSRFLVQGIAFYLEGLALNMVMEQVALTLEQFMVERGGQVDSSTVRKIAEQGLQGLQFLSSHNFVHLDIKPQNIGITHDQEVKLLDFGSCSTIHSENENAGLTPKYAAKEVLYPWIQKLCGVQADPPKYTSKGDVYSFGVCLISLLRGNHVWDKVSIIPNSKDSYVEALYYIFNNERELHQQIPANTEGPLRDLIIKMTCYDCNQRCTVGEGLQHPFITGQGRLHFDIGNINFNDLLALCDTNMMLQVKPSQDFMYNAPQQKELKPPVQEALMLPQQAMTFQQQEMSPQQLNVHMTGAAPAPAPSSTGLLGNLPVMLQDEVDENHVMMPEPAAVSTATQPVDAPVPAFHQIMSRKRYLPAEEEEVAISLRDAGASYQDVPEFGDLLTAANDYTKERQPKKQPRMANCQPTQVNGQFEFGIANPTDFVDLSFRRNAGGKRMPKKPRTVGPYDPTRKGASPH